MDNCYSPLTNSTLSSSPPSHCCNRLFVAELPEEVCVSICLVKDVAELLFLLSGLVLFLPVVQQHVHLADQ